ncbi:MAG: hypothetical protein JSR92_19735 [Proteobacteria bacterium]|nr:hypothetical protein [Pseudomonadota bacterium]
MNIKQFLKWVDKGWSRHPGETVVSEESAHFVRDIAIMGMGIAGEAGEVEVLQSLMEYRRKFA